MAAHLSTNPVRSQGFARMCAIGAPVDYHQS